MCLCIYILELAVLSGDEPGSDCSASVAKQNIWYLCRMEAFCFAWQRAAAEEASVMAFLQ